MAYDFGGGRSNDGSSMGTGGMGIANERDRMQMNLDKAFSLLDDDKPKPAHYYGEQRIGTAPSAGGVGNYGLGGGIVKSNYTGSDLGSDIGDNNS